MKRFATLILISAFGLVNDADALTTNRSYPNGSPVYARYEATLSRIITYRVRSLYARVPIRGRFILRVFIDPSGHVTSAFAGNPEANPLARAIVPIGFAFPPPPLLRGQTGWSVTVPVRFGT